MSTLAALMIATPLFGLSLDIDTAELVPVVAHAYEAPSAALALRDSMELEPLTTAELIQKRNKLARAHKILGISTWAAMTMTTIFGIIQFHNLYGGSQASNPCVRGTATFGQDQCRGQPKIHLTFAALTTVLYGATFGLSFAMPDPLGASEGDSKFARKLRMHKILRWVHFSGMLLQIIVGPIISNSKGIGLDRANDYKALRGLAIFHMSTGLVTYGALTAAGAMML